MYLPTWDPYPTLPWHESTGNDTFHQARLLSPRPYRLPHHGIVCRDKQSPGLRSSLQTTVATNPDTDFSQIRPARAIPSEIRPRQAAQHQSNQRQRGRGKQTVAPRGEDSCHSCLSPRFTASLFGRLLLVDSQRECW